MIGTVTLKTFILKYLSAFQQYRISFVDDIKTHNQVCPEMTRSLIFNGTRSLQKPCVRLATVNF